MATPGQDRVERRLAAILAAGMGRREFVSLMGGAVVAWPLAARAQAPAMPVVGFLSGASAETYERNVAAFRQGLTETGYVDGQNIALEFRWAEGQYDRLLGLAGRAGSASGGGDRHRGN